MPFTRSVQDAVDLPILADINVFKPERVVLGGSLAALPEWESPPLERAFEGSTVPATWWEIAIRQVPLGEHRLLIGAAALAIAGLLRDPARFAEF